MGLIKVTKIKENSDGSALITFQYDENFKRLARVHYKRKRCTKKLAERLVKEGMDRVILTLGKELCRKTKDCLK